MFVGKECIQKTMNLQENKENGRKLRLRLLQSWLIPPIGEIEKVSVPNISELKRKVDKNDNSIYQSLLDDDFF